MQLVGDKLFDLIRDFHPPSVICMLHVVRRSRWQLKGFSGTLEEGRGFQQLSWDQTGWLLLSGLEGLPPPPPPPLLPFTSLLHGSMSNV
jgi:hypothetical protein